MGTITLMKVRRARIVTAALCAAVTCVGSFGCSHPPPQYGVEHQLMMPGMRRQVWAVAPVLNLSGEKNVDPILQADLLFQQLQQVEGLTVIPVNRTAEALSAMHWEKVQSEQQAQTVCEMLGCDGLIVATVTAYDPYNPPKLGASLQLFRRQVATAQPAAAISPRDMARQAAPMQRPTTMPASGLVQVVGMYDAQNGSVQSAVKRFAQGRNDPLGPYAAKEYLVNMDRYTGFVYHVMIADLLNSPRLWRSTQQGAGASDSGSR
jgi:hypothetical protein